VVEVVVMRYEFGSVGGVFAIEVLSFFRSRLVISAKLAA
jgi:hypothetical protein